MKLQKVGHKKEILKIEAVTIKGQNKAIIKEIAVMEQRINSMDDKLDKMDRKLDMLTEKVLDPDYGVASRVNKNTAMRKVMSRALWVIYTVTIGLMIKMFWE